MLSTADRHRLRLAVKKLRYMSDSLPPLYSDRKTGKRFTAVLAHLQDELGHFHDMETMAASSTISARRRRRGRPSARFLAGRPMGSRQRARGSPRPGGVLLRRGRLGLRRASSEGGGGRSETATLIFAERASAMHSPAG
jgi:hypothetical protein